MSAFNEEVAIGSVVLRTRRYADRVIGVDDGSCDRTAEVAKLAGTEAINTWRTREREQLWDRKRSALNR